MIADDQARLWLGDDALTSGQILLEVQWDSPNGLTVSVNLEANSYYPIKVWYAARDDPNWFNFQYKAPGAAFTTDGTGHFFTLVVRLHVLNISFVSSYVYNTYIYITH